MDEKEMSMREALNLALDQAMAADDRVFLLGEDIADPGASGPDRRAVDEVRPRPRARHPDLGGRHRRRGHRRRDRRPAAGRRDHDHGLHRHRGRPADQQRGQAAVHDGGPHDRADHRAHPGLRRARHRRNAFAVAGGLVHAHSGDEGDRAVHAARRQGPADVGDLRRGPLPVHRDHPAAGPEGFGANRSRLLDPARPGRRQTAGHRRHASSATAAACTNALAAAAQTLEEHGVSAEVVDLRTLVPLDVETIVESVRRTRRAVVVHDAVQFAGPGAEIVAILQAECFGRARRAHRAGRLRGSSRHLRRRRWRRGSIRRRRASSRLRCARFDDGGCRWLTSSFASHGSRSRSRRPS